MSNTSSVELKKPNTRWIWVTFWILLIATVIEVGISFTSIPKNILKYIFIILTIVKAYYIVGSFMHLKYEKKSLVYICIIPTVLFITYFLIIMLYEGDALFDIKTK